MALNLDLAERETRVYLAALEARSTSVQLIARAAQTERTGTYDVLERLAIRGLVRFERVGKRTTVVAEPPRTIRDQLSAKLMAAEGVLPQLEVLYGSAVDNFSAEQVSGVDVVDRFIELVSNGFDPLRLTLGAVSVADVLTDSSTSDRLTPLPPLFAGRKTQVLVASALSQQTQGWLVELKRHLPCRRVPSPALIPTSQLIGGDSVLTVSGEGEQVSATIISSSPIAIHERAVFDSLWRTGKAME